MYLLGLIIGFPTHLALAQDLQTIEELHPPVLASFGEQGITVFFLKNTLKGQVTDVYVPNGEIFYATLSPPRPALNYVAAVIGEQITSVFFFERKFSERTGKSMFVLTKNKQSNSVFEGYSYSTQELPLMKDGDQLSLRFFRGDPPDPELQNCREGRDLEKKVNVVCSYKDAASIKKRLAALDGKAVEDPKLKEGGNVGVQQ